MEVKILIVVSQVNANVSSIMEKDAIRCIEEHKNIDYEILHVTGAFEIPLAISIAMNSKIAYSGYTALGCIIRGSTSHHKILSEEVSRNIARMSVENRIPIGYGIISCDNLEQALRRVGEGSTHNYAAQAVNATIEMINVKKLFLQNG